jgi:hypothetical protein
VRFAFVIAENFRSSGTKIIDVRFGTCNAGLWPDQKLRRKVADWCVHRSLKLFSIPDEPCDFKIRST